ncbi:UNKNOWN [Stylonychia lemnae]|uniref:Uncharacterized protein n=1 Tax=Stylonychia lemnae TaxID=5949 RepID=A0A078AC58_STYLE|nr:UNKNOWN [Stylonychia lemnae]|eukprot:CDW79865.1 UNKNOWN [Stylonychia lemnae]
MSRSVNPNQFKRNSSTTPSSFQNLAKLVIDDKSFQNAFDNSVKEQHQLKQEAKRRGDNEGGSNDLISNLMEEVKYFEIDRRRFQFDDEDPIFYREYATPSRNQSNGHNGCMCCETQFKSAKSPQYCEFCGYPYCKLCLVKTFPFPLNNPDYKNRGDICKICDRKFYIRVMVKASKQQIEVQQQTIQCLQQQLTKKEDECKILDEDFEGFVERTRHEKDKLKERKKELKKTMKQLQNENQSMNEECKSLLERKSLINTEQNELKDTIKTLKEELEDLEEKLLRINLNINKANNERSRMEEELKKFTKLGRQPKGTNAHQKNQSDSNKNSISDSQLMSSTNSKELDKNGSMISKPKTMTNSIVVAESVQTEVDYLGGSRTALPNQSFHHFSTLGSPENEGNRISRNSSNYKKGKGKLKTPQQQSCCSEQSSCTLF